MIRLRQISLAAIAATLVAIGGGAAFAQGAGDSKGGRVMVPNQKPAKEGDRVAAGYVAPRLSIGQPDLTGVWSNSSNTVLTRPGKFKTLVLSDAEEAKARAENPSNIRQATDDNQKTTDGLLDGKDLASGRGYNAFWIDPGTAYANVKGTWRTSWIVEPANGRIPYKPGASRGGGYAITNFDGPETRPQAERCVIGFSGSYGPVMQNSMYNNTMQFVQTPSHVMIQVEMIHDVRVIPIVASKAEAKHSNVPKWGGDSVGWYEGNTLVVQTTNVHPSQRGMISADGKLTERFTRWADKQVLYEFEVEDASLYSQTWKGEMGLNASQPMYEYACHEGNYAMEGILAGARQLESEGKVPGMGPGIAAGLVLPRDETGGEGFN
jgi:hypothetical protein